MAAETEVYRAVGCRECRQTGFHGRRAIFEWMDTNAEIRQLILQNVSSDLLRAAAVRGGMRTLAEDGRRLIQDGLTTIDEILSVSPSNEVSAVSSSSSS